MPRPGRGPGNFEKSKDFKGSMLRLIKNLSPWKFIMCMALGLAMVSAILALIAPNKLSDFADLIGEGLVPNTEVLEEVSKKIENNLDNTGKMAVATCLGYDDIKIDSTMQETACKSLSNILVDIEVDGVTIPVVDQIEMLKLSVQMGEEIQTEKALGLMEKLPKSIYGLVKPKMNMDAIKNLAIFMGCLYLVSALFNYIQSYSLTTVSNRFANKLRDNISKKINRLPLKYFDSR